MKRKTHDDYVEEVAKTNPYIEVVGFYCNCHTPIMHRCKIDGNEWMASPANVLRGRGCPKCKSARLRNNKIKTHEQYVEEVKQIHDDIIVVGQYAGNRVCILHKCVVDGHVWEASPNNILKGSGCPLCAIERRSVCRTKSHDEYVCEVKTINPNIEVAEQYVGAETKILHRCKIDGHEWYVLPGNILSGHGCPVCNESRGERDIAHYLNKHNVKYIPQYTFNNCKNQRVLPFDFYLPEYNVCIEYDGEQHYRSVEHFGGENGIKQRQLNDFIKTTYCQTNSIILLRIKYDQNVEVELDKFFNNTKLMKEVI